YARWLEQSLRLLQQSGRIAAQDEGFVSEEEITSTPQALWEEWERTRLEQPRQQAPTKLVDVVMRALPEILQGRRAATDVIVPKSSFELVEGVYRNNEAADYFGKRV